MNLKKCTALFLFFSALFLGGCRNKPDITNGEPIDFRLDTLTHQRFYLNQQRGKNVVLVFWATWCNPCKSELIALKAIASDPKFKDVVFAAICNDPENIDDATRIAKTLDLNFTVLLDTEAQVANKLGVKAVPTTIIVNTDGRISLKEEGYDTETMEEIKEHIQNLVDSGKNL
jgi:cytochrome c biogenesis protein CcmG, thiol:disulfide interchange protein DsbE